MLNTFKWNKAKRDAAIMKPWVIKYPFLRAIYLFVIFWIVGSTAILIIYNCWYYDYQRTWGASVEDINRYMPGDDLFDDPCFNTTRAVEIKASPEEIWPWITQIGYKRGGFYAFDKLDNGGFPSADIILPEYQKLSVGDSIPLNEYQGKIYGYMEVLELDHEKTMVWLFKSTPWKGATWSWGLYPIDNEQTKLVARLRNHWENETFQHRIMLTFTNATEIFMMRTCLLGIKLRAEKFAVNSKRGR